MDATTQAKFSAINLDDKVIKSFKDKKMIARLSAIIDMAGGSASKPQGNLLYNLATKVPPTQDAYMQTYVNTVIADKWKRATQIDEAINFLKAELGKTGASYAVDVKAFEEASGVGVVITPEDYEKLVQNAFDLNKKEIGELRWQFNFNKILTDVKNEQKWVESKTVLEISNRKQVELLGPKPVADGKRKKLGKVSTEAKKEKKAAVAAEKEEGGQTSGKDIADLMGRDCNIGANTDEQLKTHKDYLGSLKAKYLTRFPPEPNGYLHIGHAKAIRFNFTVAAENGGLCYLRFDDTNPCKENNEFIDHIKKNVEWLGYKPWKITASSDYFQDLYEIAIKLIKKGKAYVCHQTADETKEYRQKMLDSPYRNRSVDENLKLFEMMRQGRMAEGECTLRWKGNMQHENPNMRDFAAYRIRYVPHPHAGDKWCIYPTYDYTHCLVDSLENITHSLCTLEFEVRRESYFQLLKDAELYKPNVWEYSRLNMTNSVVSKRKIERLVDEGVVAGWSDPRLMTLEGLRRRGYTPSMVNDFCGSLGVARKGNENYTSIKKLEHFARTELDKAAPRTFAVLEPLEVEIVNFASLKKTKFAAPLFPQRRGEESKEAAATQEYTLSARLFIEKDDFRDVPDSKHFGLSPAQNVHLKYGPVVKLVSVEKKPDGSIDYLKVEANENCSDADISALKGHIHWVSKDCALTAKVNLY